MAVITRSVTEIRRAFVSNAAEAFVVRGTNEQLDVARWILGTLDRPSLASDQRREHRIRDEVGEDTIRVFFLPKFGSPEELQNFASELRMATQIRRVFTYYPLRAILMRSTAGQIAHAGKIGKPTVTRMRPSHEIKGVDATRGAHSDGGSSNSRDCGRTILVAKSAEANLGQPRPSPQNDLRQRRILRCSALSMSMLSKACSSSKKPMPRNWNRGTRVASLRGGRTVCLMAYYVRADHANDLKMRNRRAEHYLWLVEHQPYGSPPFPVWARRARVHLGSPGRPGTSPLAASP